MPITLRQVIEELQKRGEVEWAEACELLLPFDLMITHGFTMNKVLDMTLEEIEAWNNIPPKPLKYDGWNFWWGKAA